MAREEAGASTARGVQFRIERFIDVLGEWTSWLAIVIVVLMATAVVLRYLFSAGAVWEQELEWYLLSPLVLFGMSYALRHGEHVRVDVLYTRFSDRAKHAVNLASAILAMIISVLIIWYSIKYVQQAYVIDEGSPDPGGIPHRFILKSFVPLGFGILLLQSFATAVGSFIKLRSSQK